MDKLPSPSINLAKNRGEHLSDRILTFALTIGRVLVIITEAIALGAFLYRFGLDRQLVDYHDRITQEQAVVALLKNNESLYRNLQDRLTLEDNITTAAGSSLKIYKDMFSFVPPAMSLTDISLSDTIVHIEASIPSLTALSSFITNIQGYPAVNRVSLDKIENKTDEGIISISLTIYLKPLKNRPLL